MTVLPRSFLVGSVPSPLRRALIASLVGLGLSVALPSAGWADGAKTPISAQALDDAAPLNAWDSTDAPDDVEGAPAVTPQGTPLGQVGAVRMDPRPGVMEIAAVRIDPPTDGATRPHQAPYWVAAGRVWRLPSQVVVSAENPQTAFVP